MGIFAKSEHEKIGKCLKWPLDGGKVNVYPFVAVKTET